MEVSVTDTGIGIAPEDQEAVFEEFRQVGTATNESGRHRARAGALTEVRRAPRRAISVESRVGAGSTFTFTLPIGNGDD